MEPSIQPVKTLDNLLNTQIVITAIFFVTTLLMSISSMSQSKLETIEWLNAKFEKVAAYDVIGVSGANYLKQFLKVNQDGSFIIKCFYYKEINGRAVDSFTKAGHFKDLNPQTVTVKKIIGYSFNAICTNSKKKIASKYKDKNGISKTVLDSEVEFGHIYIDNDPDLEKRITTALKHLTTLCGGKVDTF